jgi:hypothetical protein
MCSWFLRRYYLKEVSDFGAGVVFKWRKEIVVFFGA